jgi:hypothetical protein
MVTLTMSLAKTCLPAASLIAAHLPTCAPSGAIASEVQEFSTAAAALIRLGPQASVPHYVPKVRFCLNMRASFTRNSLTT